MPSFMDLEQVSVGSNQASPEQIVKEVINLENFSFIKGNVVFKA